MLSGFHDLYAQNVLFVDRVEMAPKNPPNWDEATFFKRFSLCQGEKLFHSDLGNTAYLLSHRATSIILTLWLVRTVMAQIQFD